MSLACSINANIRKEVSSFVIGQVKGVETPIASDLAEELNHVILREIFGNIGYYQASAETDFPNVEKSIPNFQISSEQTIKMKFNLKRLVDGIKMLAVVSKNEAVQGATFRQLCVPFAEEAKEYLHSIYLDKGIVSTLAQTLPKVCEKAPWVAFDFNRGLNFKKLNQNERSVMQNLARRLMATQSKMTITEAVVDGNTGDITA